MVVLLGISLMPVLKNHAFRAMRCAGRSSVSDEMLSAALEPSTVGVVAVMARMVVLAVKLVAHRHSAGFDLERSLVSASLGLVFKAMRALFTVVLLFLGLLFVLA